MSTSSQPLKYLWTAYFQDGIFIEQTEDDRSKNHDENAEHNPSAFRDILDYGKPLKYFSLQSKDLVKYEVDLVEGIFFVNGRELSLEEVPLKNRKLIYFREMRKQWIDGVEQEPFVSRYCFGYEGKDPDGKIQKKVIYLGG